MPESRAFNPLETLRAAGELRALAAQLGTDKRVAVSGVAGSAAVHAAGALALELARPVLLITAHTDDAEDAAEELNHAHPALASVLPPLDDHTRPTASPEAFAQRARLAQRLGSIDTSAPSVLVAPIVALMQLLPTPAHAATMVRAIRRGDRIDPSELIRWLISTGSTRVDAVEEPGDVSVRGGIVDIFPATGGSSHGDGVPVRLDFFGDDLDAIHEVDPDTMGSDRAIDEIELVATDPEHARVRDDGVCALDLLPPQTVALVVELYEVVEQARGYDQRLSDNRGVIHPPSVLKILHDRFRARAELNQFSPGDADAQARVEFPASPLPAFEDGAQDALRELASMEPPTIVCHNPAERDRLEELVAELSPGSPAPERIVVGALHRGYRWNGADASFTLAPAHELLGRPAPRKMGRKLRAGRAMDAFLDIAEGDYVVHADHGVARFVGLRIMRPGKARTTKKDESAPDAEEYLTLEFAGAASLHVPCSQIDLVQKYIGGHRGKPPLSHMGGAKWKNQKAKVAESLRDLASELLRVRAAREHMPGIVYPQDTVWQAEFEGEFPYDETEDQVAALQELKRDMTANRPMDRLICGDVGFGKTEVAIRAAFKACEYGKQVAVLVPTTVLAEQHERTFRQRFADYPFKVASVSRFKSTKQINATLKGLRTGEVDVIVGTHRLLSKDVKFSDLGLVIVDEEQRFGVEHKERLLQLRMTVDVLTLSATPIPRTLHMAMLGLRDISSLTTPPMDRRAIVTEVTPYNPIRIERAIARELAREGQVFFVHNRVHNIQSVADQVAQMAPGARVVVGHGQMPPAELEAVMLEFTRKNADILVATTIIESGIDIPNANTMIINDADRFGLADLHQLRGRVGRSGRRAYCYLMTPLDRPLKEIARKRLEAIEKHATLGAGFKIAMRDLEIRGAGNLLGPEQSGHIAAVGYEMYCRLLEKAVETLEAGPGEAVRPERCTIELGLGALIPRAYIPSDRRRLEAYRRLAEASDPGKIEAIESDLTSAYGDPPAAVRRLLELAEVRAGVQALGVRSLAIRGEDLVFAAPDTAPLRQRLEGSSGSVRVIDSSLSQTNLKDAAGSRLAEVYWRPPKNTLDPESVLAVLRRRFGSRSA